MTIIEPDKPHACAPPKSIGTRRVESSIFQNGWANVPVSPKPDTIWRCRDCNLWWVARHHQELHRHGYSPAGIRWHRVKWYHFSLRRRIVEYESKWGFYGPGWYAA